MKKLGYEGEDTYSVVYVLQNYHPRRDHTYLMLSGHLVPTRGASRGVAADKTFRVPKPAWARCHWPAHRHRPTRQRPMTVSSCLEYLRFVSGCD